MRKTILVQGPFLSRSGYGEQARFAVRALLAHEDRFDVYLTNTNWGQTGWMWQDDEERQIFDSLILKANATPPSHYDYHMQVTIPNEWERYQNAGSEYCCNIGYTAGIETDRVAPVWLQKANEQIDKMIVVSNHAKDVFETTSYNYEDSNGKKGVYKANVEIEAVNYPVKNLKTEKVDLKLSTDFNFLTVAQWGPRKNLESTIGWFAENFAENENVGLIVKTSFANNSSIDYQFTAEKLEALLSSEKLKDRKCKIYLVHGDMSDAQINSLYKNRKVKALISLSHGEGFGLPMFEAAYNKLPVITTNWSGQVDYLNVPKKQRAKGKKKKTETVMKPMFAAVNHQLGPIQEHAVWENVLQKQSRWAYANEQSYKVALTDVYKNYDKYKRQANELEKYLRENFSEEKQYAKFADAVCPKEDFNVENWLDSLGEEVFE
jgi:glycosyltransferase involved in cell wall biosynthesis